MNPRVLRTFFFLTAGFAGLVRLAWTYWPTHPNSVGLGDENTAIESIRDQLESDPTQETYVASYTEWDPATFWTWRSSTVNYDRVHARVTSRRWNRLVGAYDECWDCVSAEAFARYARVCKARHYELDEDISKFGGDYSGKYGRRPWCADPTVVPPRIQGD